MVRPRSDMRKIREVLRLTFALDLTRRQVAVALGLAPSTVSDYVKRAQVAGVTWPLPEGLDTAALEGRLFRQPEHPPGQHPVPDWNYVRRELTRTGVTKWLLWEEYREQHPDGYAYSQFCNLYREWSKTVDVVMRQEHRAGEKLFIDYAGATIPIYDPLSGEVMARAQLFVAALGASSYVYAEATATQGLTDWITSHVHAFEYTDGAAKILVPDNLRSGIKKPNRYEAEITRTYEEMAVHYGAAVIPARAYRPRDKAKVEAAVLLCERWIMAKLRHQRFSSLAQLNRRIGGLLEAINEKPFKKLQGSRRTLFETIDRPALTPLPPSPTSSGDGNRSPATSTTTWRWTGTTTRSPTSSFESGSTCGPRRPPSRCSSRGRGWPPMCVLRALAGSPRHRPTCPSPTAATPNGRQGA
jgi:transposase